MSNQATKLIFWHEAKAKLPADALHCEYIESTMDSQFINTGILVSQKLQLYLRGQFESFSGNESWLFGCWNNGHGYPYDTRSYQIGFFQQNLRAEVGPDNSQYWADISRDTEIHGDVGGEPLATKTSSALCNGNNLTTVFGNNRGDSLPFLGSINLGVSYMIYDGTLLWEGELRSYEKVQRMTKEMQNVFKRVNSINPVNLV